MASDAVALGELAFSTLSTRRLSWIYMLRIIVPSALTACARTPLRAGLRSDSLTAGIRRCNSRR